MGVRITWSATVSASRSSGSAVDPITNFGCMVTGRLLGLGGNNDILLKSDATLCVVPRATPSDWRAFGSWSPEWLRGAGVGRCPILLLAGPCVALRAFATG